MYSQLLLEAGEPATAQAQLDSLSAAAGDDPQVQALAAEVQAQVDANRAPPCAGAPGSGSPPTPRRPAGPAGHSRALHRLQGLKANGTVAGDRAARPGVYRGHRPQAHDQGVFGLAAAQPQLVSEWRRQLQFVAVLTSWRLLVAGCRRAAICGWR